MTEKAKSDLQSYRQRIAARDRDERLLIRNIQDQQQQLAELFRSANDHWGYEDGIYRFYHQSFKVYYLQTTTEEIVEKLKSLLPDRELNEWFLRIIAEGTRKTFTDDVNQNWLVETRPILEAFFHARYFLEMICRYADEIKEPVTLLPSGWASVLYLYNMR